MKERTRPTQEPNPNVSPLAIQALLQHDPRLMSGGHGHVIPRPDGSKAHCGGPAVCRECHLEFVACSTTDRVAVMEGFKLEPGDELLLIAPANMPQDVVQMYGELISRRFPEVGLTIVKGFTGVQLHRADPGEKL